MVKTKRVRIVEGCRGSVTTFMVCEVPTDPRQIRWMGERISIIEADVPLPEEPATVRGEVVDG